jgi:hypothetical protein
MFSKKLIVWTAAALLALPTLTMAKTTRHVAPHHRTKPAATKLHATHKPAKKLHATSRKAKRLHAKAPKHKTLSAGAHRAHAK